MFLGIIHFLQHICLKLFYECQELLTPFLQLKGKGKSFSRVQLFMTPWTAVHQAPPSMGFSRREYWSGLPFPSPGDLPHPGIEPGLLHHRQTLHCLSHQGSLLWLRSIQMYTCNSVCLFTLLLIDYGYYEQICYKYLFINRLCPKAVFIFLFDK